MNMKKTIGICATLLAALLCAVPQSAQATGKIRALDAYMLEGGQEVPFPMPGKTLTVGDTIYIRFRLANVQWSSATADTGYANPWEFRYTGTLTGNETLDELTQIAANKPRLGLWISGTVREAECINFPMGTASDWLSDVLGGQRHYTDLVFAYTVQAGDIALPVQLANASGTGPSTGAEPYYLKCNGQTVPWAIQATNENGLVTADFAFGPSNMPEDDPDFHWESTNAGMASWLTAKNYETFELMDLIQEGVFVQAIDFEPTYFKESEGIWRSIAQGSTTADPGAPALAIEGGSATPMYLYLWTEDSSIAEIVKGGQVEEEPVDYVFIDGVTRRVGRIHIYQDNVSPQFSIKATGSVGETTKVFLSATPTNIYNAGGTGIITNFITRTVQVGEPLPPGINVTVNGKTTEKVTANADYATALVRVNVTLSEAYPAGEFTIPLKVSVKEKPELNARDYVGMSQSSVDDNTAWDTVLTIPNGQTSASLSLWMYANRGTVDTENNGILVEVDTNAMDTAARDFFTGKILPATVVVNRSTPEITADLAPITAEANTPQEITINVADAYGEMRDPCHYTVYWSTSGNDSPNYYTKIEGLTPTAAGDLSFSVTYPTKSGENPFPSMYYVVNEDGKASTKHTVAVTVSAQKVIDPVLVDRKFPENAFDEQVIATLKFDGPNGFEMPNGATLGYVFLVPLDANSSNLVESVDFGDDWKTGMLVFSGAEETDPISMLLLDGSRGGLAMRYRIVVRTERNWDDGVLVSTWNSKELTFGVTNVVPEVTQVSMSGTRLKVNGGTMGAHASLGVSKTFTAQTSEPSDIDLYSDEANNYQDDQKAFATEWTFDYGNGTPDVRYVYGPPSTALSYAFTQSGNCTVTVRMCDKDMDHNRDVWGPEFTFTVIVDAKPAVTLAPYNGLDQFYESAIGKDLGRINVNLTLAPSEEITVHLDVTRSGADDGNYPLPVLNKYDVNFGGSSGNATNDYVYFTWLDGTPRGGTSGFIITATVTNTTVNADNVPWKDLYRSATLPISVQNIEPMILTRPGTNEQAIAKNEPFKVSFEVQDVPADMTAGLTVKWTTSEGETATYTITAAGEGQYLVYNGESPSFSFKHSGSKTVTLLVQDKDRMYDQREWRYYVAPSKELVIYPRQPDQAGGRGGNVSSFSAYYTGAAGLGDGRVWADGAVVEFSNFIHNYTYDPTADAANAYARGYKVGDVDNGSLLPATDVPIDADGNHYISGSYSTYYTSTESNGLDSYFYCWILNKAEEGSSTYTGELLNFLPAVEVKGKTTANGQQLVKLPKYDKEEESYDKTVLEAIFSKEYLTSDNVGDINQDGIPDIFAVGYTYSGGKLYEFANGASEGGNADGSATDIKPTLVDFNADNDYLPADSVTSGNILITSDGWKTVGEPFTADLEIRGFDPNLNYRTGNDGLNYRVRGAWVSEPAFSPAESNAIVQINKQRGIHEFTWPMPDPDEDEEAYTEAVANWTAGLNKDNCWIPENRTDPTVADTDGDGFPDGYEYYFWYMSQVGWINEKGEWKQLNGEKFQLEDIAQGVPITPDEVAAAFNPTVKATGNLSARDTDNDGLTDLEELALGTNPIHWDTDHDGMSDLWEIMRGMNPLKAPSDTEWNVDGDAMASFTTEKTYAVAKFADAEGKSVFFALPDNGNNVLDALQAAAQGDEDDEDPTADDDDEEDEDAEEGGITNITAIAVFRYGGKDSDYMPISRGHFERDESISYFDHPGRKRTTGSGMTWGDIRVAKSRPLDAIDVDISGLTFVSFETNKALRLVHDQVYAQFDFDPRTGWNVDKYGYVAKRWDPARSSHAEGLNDTGKAINTVAYTCLDEYLVLKYRYMAKEAQTGEALRSLSDDLEKINSYPKKMTIASVLAAGTTNPNVPFEEASYTVLGPDSDTDESETSQTDTQAPTYTSTNHGADTDEDGVPDGWELYVGYNPNNNLDVSGDNDGDGLSLLAEYAGTDSCNAYEFATNAEGKVTIYDNHPGHQKGWFNKFFPTDPWDIDTDGDGLSDSDEGSTWSATFMLGRSSDQEPVPHTYTFIYGTPADNDEHTLCCVRGGGLNPCSVDTDGDLLPDPWEHDFAGVVFRAGAPWSPADAEADPDNSKYGTSISLSAGVLATINRNDAINTASGSVSVVKCYITAGMDGTFGPSKSNGAVIGDAVTSYAQVDPHTGTKRNFDFDNDGLQNFQEYLVQTLRHLRYDDTETPLMGSYLPNGLAGSRTYVGFLPMQVWDGAAFYATARAKGFNGISAYGGEGFRYRELGYFARPPKAWDPTAQNQSGINACANYDEPGYRVMLRPAGLSPNASADGEDRMPAKTYACTDPRLWDSDDDGMDDYYELFHGLNPLLGEADVISDAYAVQYGAAPFGWRYNAWVGWPMIPMMEPVYDAMMYPWFMGMTEADPDGDGLRNMDEALLVNTPSPQNYHTDPTPLWMTDASSKTSYTSQYYGRDPYMTEAMVEPDLTKYLWFGYVDGADQGDVRDFMFSFEQNEGYDTDHDWLPDGHELTRTVLPASDPRSAADPDLRQAAYFTGENSALSSYTGDFSRPIGENYAMLRQFTVEAWIRPEDVSRDQTIVTRVCDYPSSTLSNATHQVRANFRLGITAQGYVYGEYDSDDAVQSGSDFGTTTVLGVLIEPNTWTHVALSYNGAALVLYVNGREVKRLQSRLIPANGLALAQQSVTPTGANFGNRGYRKYPSVFLVGADAAAVEATLLNDKSSWANYGSFYKGWIDEVRVWDGARTDAQIIADYKKRYSLADIAALRDETFSVWNAGGTHNDNDGLPNLPAELLVHYNFQHLPSEVTADYVASEPSGFSSKMLDNVRWNGHAVDLRCGWWSAVPVASTVYANRALVPWVRNMCGLLPAMDGSTPDSRYWSELLGGVTFPVEVGVSSFLFPNTACPYPYWNYMGESYFRSWQLNQLRTAVGDGFSSIVDNVRNRFEFDRRTGFVGGADLLPLGGAYAKRCTDFWDGQGPMDAWTETADDLDADDLPDWWEALYAGVGGNPEDITPTTVITYEGQQMEAREAYLRDLAKGLLPGMSLSELPSEYCSKADRNFNDIPDWWESLYGLSSTAAWADADGDQLSDYVEWLICEGFASASSQYPRVSPILANTFQSEGQIVPDYFWPVNLSYLGGMFTDHDFMEDAWEVNFPERDGKPGLSTGKYDAHLDADDDGWSNFAECRAGTSPQNIAYLGVDKLSVPDYPVPTVKVTARYNGERAVAGATTYVQAWRADDTAGQPDAMWQILSAGDVSSDASTGSSSGNAAATKTKDAHTKLIGMNPNREVTLTLGPGAVVAGTVSFSFKDLTWKSVNGYMFQGAETVLSSTLGGSENAVWIEGAVDRVIPGDANRGDIVMVSSNLVSGTVNESLVGEVDYQTGAVTIDLGKMQGEMVYNRVLAYAYDYWIGDHWEYSYYTYYDSINLSISYVKVDWESKFAAQGFPQTYYLSDSGTATDGIVSRGRLREGKNIFAAFIDLDKNGAWSPGEPYGAVANVDVGWSGTSCAIELSDTAPQMIRLDLAAAITASSQGFDKVNEATDRGLVNLNKGVWDNIPSIYPGTNMPANVSSLTKVRVVRNWIDGSASNGSTSYSTVVLERDIDLSVHPTLTEADLFGDGVYDLDWGALTRVGGAAVERATYRIVIGEGPVGEYEREGNNLDLLFSNRYELRRTPTVPDAELAQIVYAGQPTFRWSHTNSIDKAYPAFCLRIFAADKSTVIYDSGVQQAPARNEDGMYEWTAPVYAGMATPSNVVFDTANNYYWAVSMLDAKFTEFGKNSEVKTPFRLSCTGNVNDGKGYGSIKVAVKYFGPLVDSLSTSASSLADLIHVQAFTTPDFTGMAVGEAFVTNVSDIASMSNVTVNAIIRGVPPGTYYVRAFVDSNANFQKDIWETWGYGCYVGDAGAPFISIARGNLKAEAITAANFPYTPRGYTVARAAEVPVATVYLEDADTEFDGFPDAWEMKRSGNLGTRTPISGNTFFATVNPNLLGSLSAYSLGSVVSSSATHLGFTLMGALLSGSEEAAAFAGSAEETTAVQIKSFSLENGLDLEVVNAATADASSVIVFKDEATVQLSLVCATSPDFSDAVEVPVKTITIRSNDTVVESVTAAELAAARAQAPDARFFKAVIK